MRLFILLLAAALVLASNSTAFGYLDIHTTGSSIPGLSARTLGFGGVRSMGLGDGSCLMTNPAGLGRLEGTRAGLAVGPEIGRDFMLDSLGQHETNWLSFSNLFAAVTFDPSERVGAGVAFAKVSDFTYQSSHYLFSFQPGQTSALRESRELNVAGGLYEAVGGLSYAPREWLALGASAGTRFGSASYDSTFRDYDEPQNDTTVTWKRDFSGFCWNAGLEIPLSSALLGLSWSSGGNDYRNSRLAAGGMLYFDSNRSGAFGCEIEVEDPGDRNATYVRFFGYGFTSDSFEIRGSLNFSDPQYEETETDVILGLSLGVGVHLRGLTLDGGVSWSSFGRDAGFIGPGTPEELKASRALVSFGTTLVL